MDIFTTEWMRLGEDAHEKRVAELERIREIYIPELVHRLHSALYSAKSIHIRWVILLSATDPANAFKIHRRSTQSRKYCRR